MTEWYDFLFHPNMDVFNQSPYKSITGKDSPIEPSKKTQSMIGNTFSLMPMTGIVSKASVMTKMFGVAPEAAKAAPAAAGMSVISNYGKYTYTAAGIGAGVIGSWLFGSGTKKDQAIAQQPTLEAKGDQKQEPTVYHAPYEVYQPKNDIRVANNYDYSQNYNIVSNSPGGSVSTKKGDATDVSGNTPGSWSTPSTYAAPQNMPFDLTQDTKAGQSEGVDFTKIALIGGVALIAYGYVSKPKSKTRK